MPLGLGFLPALRFFILRYPKLQDMGRLPPRVWRGSIRVGGSALRRGKFSTEC